ncbi:hypothetical protein B0H13DRAFT_1867948 [Mycena leptocephala]|nr:hypothetical protein B0H13DRAFT_1867948 [Mycena leptocephala]
MTSTTPAPMHQLEPSVELHLVMQTKGHCTQHGGETNSDAAEAQPGCESTVDPLGNLVAHIPETKWNAVVTQGSKNTVQIADDNVTKRIWQGKQSIKGTRIIESLHLRAAQASSGFVTVQLEYVRVHAKKHCARAHQSSNYALEANAWKAGQEKELEFGCKTIWKNAGERKESRGTTPTRPIGTRMVGMETPEMKDTRSEPDGQSLSNDKVLRLDDASPVGKTEYLALRDWRRTNPEVERHKDSYPRNKDYQYSPRETSVLRNGEMVHAKMVEKVP